MKNNVIARICLGSSLIMGVVATGLGQSVNADATVKLIPAQVISEPTPSEIATEAAASTTDNGSTWVRTFEDGSGVQLINGMPVRSFDAGTFEWDCAAMGNHVCGSVLPVTE